MVRLLGNSEIAAGLEHKFYKLTYDILSAGKKRYQQPGALFADLSRLVIKDRSAITAFLDANTDMLVGYINYRDMSNISRLILGSDTISGEMKITYCEL